MHIARTTVYLGRNHGDERGRKKTEAAIKAGYAKKTAAQIGSTLLRNVKVSALVQASRAKLTENTKFTKVSLVEGLVESFKDAREAKHYSGLARIGELLAKLHGMIVERRDVRLIRSIEDLSDDELAALEAQARQQAEGNRTRH